MHRSRLQTQRHAFNKGLVALHRSVLAAQAKLVQQTKRPQRSGVPLAAQTPLFWVVITARKCSSSASKTEMRRWTLQMRHHAFSKRLVAPHRYASVGVGLRQQQSAVLSVAQTLSFWVVMTAGKCSSSASKTVMRP